MASVILDGLLETQAPRFCASLIEAMLRCDPAFSVGIGCGRGTRDLLTRLEPPLLMICIDREEALFGPLFIPGRTPCPTCLHHWTSLRLYDRVDETTESGMRGGQLVAATLHAWFEAFRHDGRLDELDELALSMDLRTGMTARHPVFRRRDCSLCGMSQVTAPRPLEVHCSPWTGIVRQVELTRLPTAGAFRARGVWTPPVPVGAARSHLQRQPSFGRGRTPLEARRGCVAEALERYSLVYRGDEPMTRARFDEIDAIHPGAILLFSEQQYANRLAWNATSDELFHVPEPFDGDVQVDWIAAQPLGTVTRPTFVAAATCLMWYEFRLAEPEFARADTIGCASGHTFEDALYKSLLEWIERDALAIWWDNMLPRPGLLPESFESPEIDAVVEGLRAVDRELCLLDCTTDIGIPAYVAVAPRRDGSEPLIAAAADLSPHVAAYRAASEVGQVWYEIRRTRTLPHLLTSWLLDATVAAHPYLAPSRVCEAVRPQPVDTDRRSSVVVAHLEAVGLQAYAVDHSRSDVCIPTVRAIVPGLRHIWNRRAQGRLFDIPVKMGWRSDPALEADLNPVRCMV